MIRNKGRNRFHARFDHESLRLEVYRELRSVGAGGLAIGPVGMHMPLAALPLGTQLTISMLYTTGGLDNGWANAECM